MVKKSQQYKQTTRPIHNYDNVTEMSDGSIRRISERLGLTEQSVRILLAKK